MIVPSSDDHKTPSPEATSQVTGRFPASATRFRRGSDRRLEAGRRRKGGREPAPSRPDLERLSVRTAGVRTSLPSGLVEAHVWADRQASLNRGVITPNSMDVSTTSRIVSSTGRNVAPSKVAAFPLWLIAAGRGGPPSGAVAPPTTKEGKGFADHAEDLGTQPQRGTAAAAVQKVPAAAVRRLVVDVRFRRQPLGLHQVANVDHVVVHVVRRRPGHIEPRGQAADLLDPLADLGLNRTGPQIIAGFIVTTSQRPSLSSADAFSSRSVSTLLRAYACRGCCQASARSGPAPSGSPSMKSPETSAAAPDPRSPPASLCRQRASRCRSVHGSITFRVPAIPPS